MDAQLTPLSFLRRSAEVHPDKTAVIHGSRRLTYRELADEAQRLADALRSAGVAPGDRVAYLLPNVPEMVVAHMLSQTRLATMIRTARTPMPTPPVR